MIRFRYVIFAVLCLSVFPIGASAECDYSRKAELNKIAGNVQLNYSYSVSGNETPEFKILVSNVSSDIYVEYSSTGGLIVRRIEGQSESVIDFYDGSNMEFNIYSADPSCYGEKISTRYVETPSFNHFYLYSECIAHPEFKYCSPWMKTGISDEQFESEYEEYVSEVKSDKAIGDEDNKYQYLITALLIFLSVFCLVIIIKVIVHFRRRL